MPICPGCGSTIPYERLSTHEQWCPGIWSPEETVNRRINRLQRRVRTLEDQSGGVGRESSFEWEAMLAAEKR